MPAETRSIRDGSAVGRFPAVTLGFGEDTDEEKKQPKENIAQTENACQQWLRKICPCCRPKSHEDDLADTLVTGTDDPEKEDQKNGKKPLTGDCEINGNWRFRKLTIMLFMKPNELSGFTLSYLCSQNCFSMCNQ